MFLILTSGHEGRLFPVIYYIQYRSKALKKKVLTKVKCYSMFKVPFLRNIHFLIFLSLFDSKVTKAWGYFLWGGRMYITSSGPESSPHISFPVSSGTWYNLKSEVKGTRVKIYVNNKLVREITMSGSGADSTSSNAVGIWCHNRIPIKGDSFQGKYKADFFFDKITQETGVSFKTQTNISLKFITTLKKNQYTLSDLS